MHMLQILKYMMFGGLVVKTELGLYVITVKT